VDAEGGGRLIYYDFGMMGRIPSDIRGGLLELFYGVYEKDPDRRALGASKHPLAWLHSPGLARMHSCQHVKLPSCGGLYRTLRQP
jgi:hypothetical protein